MTLHSITCNCDVEHSGDRCETVECRLPCIHGGQPNSDCTACEGCYPGWSGSQCDQFSKVTNPSQLLQQYQAHFTDCLATANKSIADWSQNYNPIPGWREVANSYDSVTGDFKIPFVGFTFENGHSWINGNGTSYSVPDQMLINTGFVPGATPQMPQAFRMVDEVSAFQIPEMLNGTGHFGWLGGLNDPAKLYSQYYSQGLSLAVYQTFFPLYSLNVTGSSTNGLDAGNTTLSRYALAALKSLPPKYDASTEDVFNLFLNTFGTSMATVSLRGGGIEDVVGWSTCLWKGPKPQTENHGTLTTIGLRDCLLDTNNFAEMVAARNFSQRSRVVSSVKFGGNPAISDQTAWAKTISTAPVVLSYSTHVRLSKLIPSDMGDVSDALDQAITSYEQNAVNTISAKAKSVRSQQNSQARPAVFLTDIGGACKSGQLAPGQTWDVSCGPSIAPFKSTVDMHASSTPDGTASVLIEGGGNEVSCGCSDVQIDVFKRQRWLKLLEEEGIHGIHGSVLWEKGLGNAQKTWHLTSNSSSSPSPSPSPLPSSSMLEKFSKTHPSPVVPKDIKCKFNKKMNYPGNTIIAIPDISDAGRCCDLCDAHHSCQFWTYHFHSSLFNYSKIWPNVTQDGLGSDGKTCELKSARSDTQCCDPKYGIDDCPHDCRHVIVSGSRHGDAPPQDWAHFCFQCTLPSHFQQIKCETTITPMSQGFPMFV
jgi:hypothetical protein